MRSTKTAIKLLIGMGIVVLGVVLLLPGYGNLWRESWILIKGSFPIILILFGALMVWVEAEEMRGPPKPKKK